MDSHFWLELAIAIISPIMSALGAAAVVIYNRGKADATAKALAAANRDESIGRFKLNEARIGEQTTRIDNLSLDVKALQGALMENSVALARIDERGIHMAEAVRRIEDKIDANTIVPKPKV